MMCAALSCTGTVRLAALVFPFRDTDVPTVVQLQHVGSLQGAELFKASTRNEGQSNEVLKNAVVASRVGPAQ